MTEPDHPTDRPMKPADDEAPPRIAFVVDWLEDSYQTSVLAGAAEVARERGANLVALLGGVIGSPHAHGIRRNKLYELLSPASYDGVIVMTGTIANAHGVDVMSELCPDFPRHRICNIAIQVPGSPAVLIDNTRGMRRLIDHMIRAHGHRKLAFIRGPESNPEAEARYAAYRDVLAAHRIPLDDNLVVQGDFLREAGARAVATLFDERGLGADDIDAILAADDLMALATLEELGRRNISVPSDIAVTGFDDVEEARYATPPLSSVRQPLFEQGAEAMRLVLEGQAGEANPLPLILDTTCQYRRSCGCTAEEPGLLTERPRIDARLSLPASLVRRKDLIVAEMSRFGHGAFTLPNPDWSEDLFRALLRSLDDEAAAFRTSFDAFLHEILLADGEVAIAQDLLTALRKQMLVCAGEEPEQIRQVETRIHDARLLASDAVERAQAKRRLESERLLRVLADVSFHLCNCSSEAVLADLIELHLPRLGIQTCYISGPLRPEKGKGQLLAALRDGKRCKASLYANFQATDLLPHGHEQPGDCLVVEPLCDDQAQYGFAVFRLGEIDGFMYEIVRRLLTAAVSRSHHLPH